MPEGRASARLTGASRKSSQAVLVSGLSSASRRFWQSEAAAQSSEAASGSRLAGVKSAEKGSRMTSAPTKPAVTASQRVGVTFSPSTRPAPRVTKKGEVMTSATAAPIGTRMGEPGDPELDAEGGEDDAERLQPGMAGLQRRDAAPPGPGQDDQQGDEILEEGGGRRRQAGARGDDLLERVDAGEGKAGGDHPEGAGERRAGGRNDGGGAHERPPALRGNMRI